MSIKYTRREIHCAQWSAMLLLFGNGILYSTWGVSIPLIKARFGVSEVVLSLSMAAVAVGGIAMMKQSGKWIVRYGSGRFSVFTGILMSLASAFILLIPDYTFLLVLLLVFGMFAAANDVACNAQVAHLEHVAQRSMIGGLHGSFSAGGLTGAMISSGWTSTALPAASNFYLLAILVCSISLMSSRYLKNEPDIVHGASVECQEKEGAYASLQKAVHRRLLCFGLLAFAALVVEGAFYDWAGVYMHEVIKAPPSWVGFGYAAFSVGLVIGRLSGDWIRDRLAHHKVVTCSWVISMSGLCMMLWVSGKELAVVGFFLTGIGMSNIIPILFSSAGKLAVSAGVSASLGLAITTRIAYVGLLAGPLIIGPFAQLVGLRFSLLSLVIAISATCGGWLILSLRNGGAPWNIGK